jgi:hypothetical protein
MQRLPQIPIPFVSQTLYSINMKTQNSVYIAQSLDGYIADKNGGIAWLDSVPNPEGDDMGYFDFANRMDALVMGRNLRNSLWL